MHPTSEGMSRTVVVTGGSRGLGLKLVEDLLARGYHVTAVFRNPTPAFDLLARDHGPALSAIVADLGDRAALRSLAARLSGGPPLYALVNNAAVAVDGLLVSTDLDALTRMITVNLEAVIVLARAAARRMIPVREGRIVNVSSIAAGRAYSGLAAYAATKAGMEGFTRTLARELGPRRITVNCVAPGFLETDMTAALGPTERDAILRRSPLRQPVTCEDVAAVVGFLLSPGARMLTGCTIPVDGGSHL